MKRLLIAIALCLFAGSAYAACTPPLAVKDGAGNSVNMSVVQGADGSCQYYIDIDASSRFYQALTSGVGTPGSTAPSTNVSMGSTAATQEPTARTNGQNVNDMSDAVGKRIVLPYANPENFLTGLITTAMTGTTDTAVTGMGAQGAGVRNYITQCTVSNSHASVGTDVVLKDGSGGSVLWTFPAAASYGGAVVPFPTPLKTTANTALYAANITTGASTKVSCTGYKGV